MAANKYLDLEGLAHFLSKLDDKYLVKTATAADSSKLNGQAASYYLNYNNLTNKPTIPTKTSDLTNDSGFITTAALSGYATKEWVEDQGYLTSVAWGDITDKPTFATVATSGSYNDLSNKPTIPTVSNATITIKQAGISDQTFTLNGSAKTITLVDTTYSEATTDASGLMSAGDKTKLNGIAAGAEVNVQSDWNITDSTSDAYIKNKPTIPAAQVNSDWNATSGVAKILNKPTLGTAAAKDFTTSVTSGSSDLVTSGAVYAAIDNLPSPMVFKGSVGDNTATITWTNLPAASISNEGWTYKVIAAHATAPICKIGDTIISNGSEWVVIPSGDEPGGTVTSVGLSLPSNEFAISNSPVTSSGTLTGSWKNQSANKVFAGPASGSAAAPTFRSIVAADLPVASATAAGIVSTNDQIFSGDKTFDVIKIREDFNTGDITSRDFAIFNQKIIIGTGTSSPEVIDFPIKSGTIALLDDIPTNYVTTDTSQTITGGKQFTKMTIFGNPTSSSSSYVDIQSSGVNVHSSSSTVSHLQSTKLILNCSGGSTTYGAGAIGVNSSGTDYTLTLPNKTDTIATLSDIPSTSNFVTLDGDQTITGEKDFRYLSVLDSRLYKDKYQIVGTASYNEGTAVTYTHTLPAYNTNLLGIASAKAAGRFYSGTTAPTNTTRLNYDGYFYAKKLYSENSEVVNLASTQTITGSKTFDSIVNINQDNPAYIRFKTDYKSTTIPDWLYFGDRIIAEYSDRYYQIEMPTQSGTLALTSDLPQVKRYI